jgi:hypothetical protein
MSELSRSTSRIFRSAGLRHRRCSRRRSPRPEAGHAPGWSSSGPRRRSRVAYFNRRTGHGAAGSRPCGRAGPAAHETRRSLAIPRPRPAPGFSAAGPIRHRTPPRRRAEPPMGSRAARRRQDGMGSPRTSSGLTELVPSLLVGPVLHGPSRRRISVPNSRSSRASWSPRALWRTHSRRAGWLRWQHRRWPSTVVPIAGMRDRITE